MPNAACLAVGAPLNPTGQIVLATPRCERGNRQKMNDDSGQSSTLDENENHADG